MGNELRIERLFDAQPEVVFDAFVDPEAQAELHGSKQPGWVVHRCETDVRVGGTSTYVMGPEDGAPDTEMRVYSEVDRPRRLVFQHTMHADDADRAIVTEMTITFEGSGGKTLLTMVESGFERVEDRDDYMTGWPVYLDTLQSVVDARGGSGA